MSDVLIGLRFDLYVFKYSDDECFVYVRRESWLQEDVCCVLSVVCCLDKRIVANGVFVTLLSHLYVLSETDCRQLNGGRLQGKQLSLLHGVEYAIKH
jgi:hypothetical protein